jgi:G3E family GTPase
VSARIPFSVLTGGLGSGKTTLLARLLRHPAMARTGVVVNEFGEIALDAVLLGHAGEHTVVLAGGCVCCAAQGDFAAAVRRLAARGGTAPLERVVIETSGLADPVPILHALATEPDLAARYVAGGVITIVDALQGERALGRQPLALRQVALADRIVLTKSDIAAPRAVPRLQQRLHDINPTAPVLVASHGEVTPQQLFGDLPERAPPPVETHPHRHGAGPRAICLRWAEPLPWESFWPALQCLVEAQGEKLLRLKGVVQLAGAVEPVVVQGVRGFLHPPARLAAWPDGDPCSRVVFITDGIDEATIRAALR